jgi:glutamine amidotransferase-like uncharacterized protein
MQKVLIYNDKGTSSRCIQALVLALQDENVHRNYSIDFADRFLFKSNAWQGETALLIFPGGRDIPYHRALKGRVNQKLREYVESGGNYFGICAGGYYGSASVEFEKGNPLEVIENRELAFFPDKASGPAYGLGEFCYETEKGSKIAKLKIANDTNVGMRFSAAYYNGGCTFVNAAAYSNVDIVAYYAELENAAAIVQCQVGKGRAILSGVHPEYGSNYLKESFHIALLPALKEIESQRKELFKHLLLRLGITFVHP